MKHSEFSINCDIFINGKRTQSDLLAPIFEEDSVSAYESLRSYHGVIFRAKDHLKRLTESAHTLGLKLPKSIPALEAELQACLKQSGRDDAFLRLGVDCHNSYILIGERRRPEWIYEKGIDLQTVPIQKNIPHSSPAEVKTSSFLVNVLASMEKDEQNYDVILLDSNGYVTESTVWNFFMVKRANIYTAELGILRGVTRQFVIECAHLEGLPVIESNLTRHDIWNADEAFLTNTSGEVVPIRSLDARLIGCAIPGLMTQRLMRRFKKELMKELGVDEN